MNYFEFLYNLGSIGDLYSPIVFFSLIFVIILLGYLFGKYLEEPHVLLLAFPALIFLPAILFFGAHFFLTFTEEHQNTPGNIVRNYTIESDLYEQIDTAQKDGDTLTEAKLFSALGQHFNDSFNQNMARQAYYNSMNLYEKLNDLDEIAFINFEISYSYYSENNHEMARQILQASFEHYENTDNIIELSAVHNFHSQIDEQAGNLHSALSHARLALQHAQSISPVDENYMGDLFRTNGRLEFLNNNYERSRTAYDSAIDKFSETANQTLLIETLIDLSDVYYTYEHYELALKQLSNASEIYNEYVNAKDYPNLYYQNQLYDRYAVIFSDTGDLDALRENYRKHRTYFETISGSYILAHSISTYASYELDNSQIDVARNMYLEAIEIMNSQFDYFGSATTYTQLASLEKIANNPEKAIEYSQQAISTFSNYGYFDLAHNHQIQLDNYKNAVSTY